jgi:ribosome maturation factor RimP
LLKTVEEKIQHTAREVAALVEPVLRDLGFELVDVEFLHTQGRWVLRLTIDREGGVTVDDCARVSRELGDLIDVKDLIRRKYFFEVSSPGLDRPLKKERDVLRAVGKKIKVKMTAPIQGRRNFSGYLSDFVDGTLVVKGEQGEVSLPWTQVQKANLIYEFNDPSTRATASGRGPAPGTVSRVKEGR